MVLLLGDWIPEQKQAIIEIDTRDEFVILNLEGPILSDVSSYAPSLKTGPHLYSKQLPVFEDALGVCFSLANNHIKDYGWQGVVDTLKCLNDQEFHWAGVGENEQSAQQPRIVTVDGCRIAIFSLCEIQAGRATFNQAGCAVLGPWIFHAIGQIRSEVDYVIVSVHAGNEFLPWPSPIIQDLYRSYIDAGANVVHGHHSHVPQGVERYKNGLICYGLGNFLGSTKRYGDFETNHSLGIRLKLSPDQIDYDIETYYFRDISNNVVVSIEDGDRFNQYLAAIQEPLKNRQLLEALWQEASLWLYDKYGRDSIGLPITTEQSLSKKPHKGVISYIRFFARKYNMSKKPSSQKQILWYHMFACLSHQYMMETALGLLSGEIKDIRNSRTRVLLETHLSNSIR